MPAADAQVQVVGVDPRIELMAIMFRLAGAPEYRQARVPVYVEAIEKHFGAFAEHEGIRIARQFRKGGVGYDAVMNLAVRITDIDRMAERVPFEDAKSGLNSRWKGAKARTFLAAARRFVADTRFHEFLDSQKTLFELTDSRLREFTSRHLDMQWHDRFFGAKPKARFCIIAGLANGNSSYATRMVTEDGAEEVYGIGGVMQLDAAGQPVFRPEWSRVLVHEFAHPYVDGLIKPHRAALEKAGRELQKPIRERMMKQGYGTWENILEEALVRAASTRYILDHQGAEAACAATSTEESRGFVWTSELVRLLDEYEGNRARYPTLDAFMPRIRAFFAQVAPQVPEMLRKAR